MSDFSEGYVDGYQALKRTNAIPSIPAYAIPAGKTPYQHGYEQGWERAREILGLSESEAEREAPRTRKSK